MLLLSLLPSKEWLCNRVAFRVDIALIVLIFLSLLPRNNNRRCDFFVPQNDDDVDGDDSDNAGTAVVVDDDTVVVAVSVNPMFFSWSFIASLASSFFFESYCIWCITYRWQLIPLKNKTTRYTRSHSQGHKSVEQQYMTYDKR
jgi:hypothetical protein